MKPVHVTLFACTALLAGLPPAAASPLDGLALDVLERKETPEQALERRSRLKPAAKPQREPRQGQIHVDPTDTRRTVELVVRDPLQELERDSKEAQDSERHQDRESDDDRRDKAHKHDDTGKPGNDRDGRGGKD